MRRVLTAAGVLAALVALARPPAEAAETINRKVVQFARAYIGQQVGNGECWTLADRALQAAGAHRPGTRGYPTYVFGKQISRPALQPGDIIQFEGVRFKHYRPNGSWSSNEFPHHTAVVAGVRGTRITLLHQNVSGKRTVQTGVIDMADFRRGTLRYYRPQPR
jgi:cell wall-associated NlpC family hydrolase